MLGPKYMAYAPHFRGAITPEESVKPVLGSIEKSGLENGEGGASVSHIGTKEWFQAWTKAFRDCCFVGT